MVLLPPVLACNVLRLAYHVLRCAERVRLPMGLPSADTPCRRGAVRGLALRASPAAAAGFILGMLTAAMAVSLALSEPGLVSTTPKPLLGAASLLVRALSPVVPALRAAHAALSLKPEAVGVAASPAAAAANGNDAPCGALQFACRVGQATRAALARPVTAPRASPVAPEPAFSSLLPQSLWAWRAAARPQRTLLLISALHTPRVAALWALAQADPAALEFLLGGVPANASPAHVAAATIRFACAVFAAPSATLGGAAWRARAAAPFAAHWAAGLYAADAILFSIGVAGALAARRPARAQLRAAIRAFYATVPPTAVRLSCVATLSRLLPLLPSAASDAALLIGAGLLPAADLAARIAPLLRIADAAAAAAAAAAANAAAAAVGQGGASPRRGLLIAVPWESLAAAAAAAAGANGAQGASNAPASAGTDADAEADGTRFPPPLVLPPSVDEVRLPDYLRCPVTLCAMREPAITPAGITYERAALLRWVREHGTEPTTRRRMGERDLAPNLAARAALEAWAREHATQPFCASVVPAAAPAGVVRRSASDAGLQPSSLALLPRALSLNTQSAGGDNAVIWTAADAAALHDAARASFEDDDSDAGDGATSSRAAALSSGTLRRRRRSFANEQSAAL